MVVSKERYCLTCECGKTTTTLFDHLRSNHTKSCGCYSALVTSKAKKVHGWSQTRVYDVWYNMVTRCTKPGVSSYENYGGRGIKVCDEWLRFEPFRDWALSHGYKDNLTIERINNDIGYSPDNCKWIPKSEQGKNRRTNTIIEYNGETKILSEWAEHLGINTSTLCYRLKAWDIERAFTQPVAKRRHKI